MPGWHRVGVVGLWVLIGCGRSDLAFPAGAGDDTSDDPMGDTSDTLVEICELNADCPASSICVDTECVCITGCNPCMSDADCPAALRCEAGACRGGRECSEDEQCAPAQGCFDFECVPNVACEVNGDCEEGQICGGGFCDAGSECTLHSHCPPGMFCQNDDCKDYLGGG